MQFHAAKKIIPALVYRVQHNNVTIITVIRRIDRCLIVTNKNKYIYKNVK